MTNIYKEVERAFENRFYTVYDLLHHHTYIQDIADSLGVKATPEFEAKIIEAQNKLLGKLDVVYFCNL